jgi:hypothetical protein
MGKLTKKKTLKSRKPLKKSLKSRKTLKKKVGGWSLFKSTPKLYGARSKWTRPFGNFGDLVRRPTGYVSYVNQAGKLVKANRATRGKKALGTFWRGRTFEEASKYRQHRTARLQGMLGQYDAKAFSKQSKIFQKQHGYDSKINILREKLERGKANPKYMKKLQKKLKCSNPDECLGKINAIQDKHTQKIKTLNDKMTKSLEPFKAQVDRQSRKFQKMQANVGVKLTKKISSTNTAISKGAVRKCKTLPPGEKMGCLTEVFGLLKSGKPITINDINAINSFQRHGKSITRDDIIKANTRLFGIGKGSASRKFKRAESQSYKGLSESYKESDAQLLARSEKLTKPSQQYIGAPQVVPAQGAPQVVPAQGAPQVVPAQGAPQVVPAQGAPQVVPAQGAPQVVPAQGAPQVVPAQGAPQVVPAQGAPPVAPPDKSMTQATAKVLESESVV